MSKMTAQNYCMVNQSTNVCDNVIIWDGDVSTWTPPLGYTMLVQDTTPAKNWQLNPETKMWELSVMGVGNIEYTWDGTYLTTNLPAPPAPEKQPTQQGAENF